MDDETRAAFAALNTALVEGLGGLRGEMSAGLSDLRGEMHAGLSDLRGEMNTGLSDLRGEMIAGLSDLRAEMVAGFARTDRYFELQQAQHVELRGEVRQLRDRMDALESRMSGLETGVTLLREYVTREITAIRQELRELQLRSDQNDELRREIGQLAARVDRLERSRQD